jgi:HEAT repeat protein
MRLLWVVAAAWLGATASLRAEDVAELAKRLKSADVTARRGAAKSLQEFGPAAAAAVPDLTAALRDKDAYVRRFAAQALAAVGPDAREALPALKALLGDRHKEVVDAAAEALGKVGGEGFASLTTAVKDRGKPLAVRKKAIAALGKLGDDARPAVPVLVEALADRDLRLEAIVALGELGPAAQDAVKALTEIAQDRKSGRNVRQLALQTLRKIQGKKKA